MRLISRKSQYRRDFTGVYECEHCGYTHESYGYDDDNFHRNVIPNRRCPKCSKKGLGQSSHPVVPEGVIL